MCVESVEDGGEAVEEGEEKGCVEAVLGGLLVVQIGGIYYLGLRWRLRLGLPEEW